MTSSADTTFKDGEELFPSADELETYYNMLENGSILELDWQCPGRRPPSPDVTNASKDQNNLTETIETQEPMKTNDFDFSDDVAQPQMRARHGTPKSLKKKTANFAGVMEALKKKNAEGSN
ncbi:uncharacterized protein LOC106090673 [Stomoxys calcitrans]|uniref:uncharacterized protein LOC106090673 n=1 Tax=Stomoxys calcitrans TaxID=35570 RepID=UPI0027E30D28|nr:uncharacterized protein LOC106090673 [Stomoxys calcitrans]